MLDPQGFDAGKKITGRKRHILVDTLGLLLSVAVHPANIQDRDGVALVLDRRTRRLFPFIERIYGDGGYQGPKAAKAAAKTGYWTIEIVERSSTAVGFEVLPKRWIVERTFAWLSHFRCLARVDPDHWSCWLEVLHLLELLRHLGGEVVELGPLTSAMWKAPNVRPPAPMMAMI